MSQFSDAFGHASATPVDPRLLRRVQHAVERGEVPSDRDIEMLEEQVGPAYEPEPFPDEDLDYERPYYTEADRQRANLRHVDVAFIQGWRAGDVEWDQEAFGPDPDDPGCLLPFEVLQEAR